MLVKRVMSAARLLVWAAASMTGLVPAGVAHAQPSCDAQWLPTGDMLPGVVPTVRAVAHWDPDGPGPLASRVVVGHDTTVGPAANVTGFSMWDGQSWSAMDPAVTLVGKALVALPNGDLIGASQFTIGGSTYGVARWTGSTWEPLGSTMFPGALGVDGGGNLLGAGGFTPPAGPAGIYVARWNGSLWAQLGGAFSGALDATATQVLRLLTLADGSIIAVGNFTDVGGAAARGLARFNGTTWESLGLNPLASVTDVVIGSDGAVVVSGKFGTIPDLRSVQRFDGVSWVDLGTNPPSNVTRLFTSSAGSVFAAAGQYVYTLDAGGVWRAVLTTATVNDAVRAPDGMMTLGGAFSLGGGLNVVGWDGAAEFASYGSGTSGPVNAFSRFPDGRIVAGGAFTSIEGTVANKVAVWDGGRWSSLGDGVDGIVYAVLAMPNGDLFAGGSIGRFGYGRSDGILRWNGSQWMPLDTGVTGSLPLGTTVKSIVRLADGSVLVAGNLTFAGGSPTRFMARWDGSQWLNYPSTGGLNPPFTIVNKVIELPNGDLLVGGEGSTPVARWNGTSWTFTSGITQAIVDMLLLPDGTPVAASASGIFRLSGTTWVNMGLSTNAALRTVALYDGRLVAAGNLTAIFTPVNKMYRYNGAAWEDFAPGITYPRNEGYIQGLFANGDDLLVGGLFTKVNQQSSPFFARYTNNPLPRLGGGPSAVSAAAGATVTLTALPIPGFEGVSYQWEHDGVPVGNGPGGAAPGGGSVDGASGSIAGRTTDDPVTLTITGAQRPDRGSYALVLTNACGSSSAAATLTIACTADFDNDGDTGTDGDIEAFFACLSGNCCATCPGNADFDGDGDAGTDADIEAFFRVLAGGSC